MAVACCLQPACRETLHDQNGFVDNVAICVKIRNHLREVQ